MERPESLAPRLRSDCAGPNRNTCDHGDRCGNSALHNGVCSVVGDDGYLASNLLDGGKQKFWETSKYSRGSQENIDLLLRKRGFCHDSMNDWSVFTPPYRVILQ